MSLVPSLINIAWCEAQKKKQEEWANEITKPQESPEPIAPAPTDIPRDESELPLESELPKMQILTLMHIGTTPFDRTWGQLATNKPDFIAKMCIELKKHRETPTGNPEYMMMRWVWHYYHESGEPRVPPQRLRDVLFPPPPPNPHGGQFWTPATQPLNPGSAQPMLTQTRSHEQVVQWTQGNRIIMRPIDREVMPGERMTNVRILGKR